jgi:hypothetical protein
MIHKQSIKPKWFIQHKGSKVKISLPEIRSDYQSFLYLSNIAKEANELFLDDIEIDMINTKWLEANMCAPLGAILYKASSNANTVKILTKDHSGVKEILSKNGFLSDYGIPAKSDTYGTTIKYKRFESDDKHYFAYYVKKELVGKGIPEMSKGLLKKFRNGIFEIFDNAVIHSRTELGIFSCGQYFPKKNRLDFCITDLGVGIKENVKEYIGKEISANKAIVWALDGKNTTKANVSGGIGLKILQEFIRLNQGRIQIISDKGYWELSNNGTTKTKLLENPFPGTVINLEINTADTNSYCLASELEHVSELENEDIF